MKIACAVFGDNRILWKALVVLQSIGTHNHNLDLFICAPEQNPDKNFLDFCTRYGISYLPFDQGMRDFNDNFGEPFSRYPKELFIKYYLPSWFYKQGYDYFVSVDYDIICAQNYLLSDIIPVEELMSWRHCRNIGEVLDHGAREAVKREFCLDDSDLNCSFPNAGFMVYNLELFCNTAFDATFKRVFRFLGKFKISHPVDEPAYGITMRILKQKPKFLDGTYNCPPAWGRIEQITRNIHYNIHLKPWSLHDDFTQRRIFWWNETAKIGAYVSACNIYLDHVKRLPFMDKAIPGLIADQSVFFSSIQKIELDYRNRLG